MDSIQSTLQELGVKTLRPLRRTIFIKTLPPPQKTDSGLLWLPPSLSSFYGEMPHLRILKGEVLAVGPTCTVKVGETVAFQRLHFARWTSLSVADTYVGWIDETHLVGYPLD